MKESDLTILLECRVGSRAYGTSTPESDEDFKGFGIAPLPYYFGFLHRFEQLESRDPDRVIYNVTKFLQLAAEANPSILDVLFCAETDIIHAHPLGLDILASRDLFISKKARFTFGGYAYQQLSRIKRHRSWLLNPPSHEPTRGEFGLPDYRTWSATEMGILVKQHNKDEAKFAEQLGEKALDIWYRERNYQNVRKYWEQYQNWKANRNSERAALEEEFGLDCKHASHLVRLLRMAKEILTGQGVQVRRPDAEELLAIRRGAQSYEEIVEWAERAEAELDTLYETSTLPREPPREKIDNLLTSILCQHFGNDIKLANGKATTETTEQTQ